MAEFTIQEGKNYSFLSKIDPRYTLKLSSLLSLKFSTLEKLMLAVEKMGLNGTKFYMPDKANLTASGEYPVYYQINTRGLEVAKIKAIID